MEPFTNLEYVPIAEQGQVSAYASQLSGNFQAIQIGAGNQSYKADRTGIWMGANTFAAAPFSVDMQGNIWANSIVIAGLDGSVIASAIDADGNFIKQLLSSNFNTQTKLILGEFSFSGSGAIAIKTDASNGLWLSPTGILSKKAGATTFAIDTSGNASFSGAITASSISGATVTGGTITGANIQSATSGPRVVINGTALYFYINAALEGYIVPDGTESMIYSSDRFHRFFSNAGTWMGEITTNGMNLASGKKYAFASGRSLTDVSAGISCDGDFVPKSDEVGGLGWSNRKWDNIYANKVWQSTNTNGSRQVYDFAYIEMNLLPKRLINLRTKKGVMMANGYVEGLEMPFKQGTLLKWGAKGLEASSKATDFVVAVADEKGLPIVLGAEPVRVIGKAKIGDAIVPSGKKGLAKAIGMGEVMIGQSLIGRCLKNKISIKEDLILTMIK